MSRRPQPAPSFGLFGAAPRPDPRACAAPFEDNGAHRCATCGKSPAPFGLGTIQRPESLRYFCQEHRPNE